MESSMINKPKWNSSDPFDERQTDHPEIPQYKLSVLDQPKKCITEKKNGGNRPQDEKDDERKNEKSAPGKRTWRRLHHGYGHQGRNPNPLGAPASPWMYSEDSMDRLPNRPRNPEQGYRLHSLPMN
uniref:Uncharacterized protein n=1 Tax=Oryza meridionalis TaxID=40149 RepID=A0A0E0E1L8_9ORYZ